MERKTVDFRTFLWYNVTTNEVFFKIQEETYMKNPVVTIEMEMVIS